MNSPKLHDLKAYEPYVEPECSPSHKSSNINTSITAKLLVLDDFLAEVNRARHLFKIAPAKLSLDSLYLSHETSTAVARMLQNTIERQQGQIFTLRDPLLDPLGDDIYGQEFKSLFAPRHQVSLSRQMDVLRRILELGLEVIVSLPSKDPGNLDCKALKSLASTLSRLSEKLHAAHRDDHVKARLKLLAAKPELWRLSVAVQDAAETLQAAANLKLRKINLSSPNPQTRFALYLADWLKTCTGRPHYAVLADLIEAAFLAVGKNPPKWIDRLEIEMNRKRRLRRQAV